MHYYPVSKMVLSIITLYSTLLVSIVSNYLEDRLYVLLTLVLPVYSWYMVVKYALSDLVIKR